MLGSFVTNTILKKKKIYQYSKPKWFISYCNVHKQDEFNRKKFDWHITWFV